MCVCVKTNRLNAVGNVVRDLNRFEVLVARQRRRNDALMERSGRPVAAKHSDDFTARRTLLLTPGEVFIDTTGAECVAAGQLLWHSDIIHTDDALFHSSQAVLCNTSQSVRVIGCSRGKLGRFLG